jgi:hypothetical protein
VPGPGCLNSAHPPPLSQTTIVQRIGGLQSSTIFGGIPIMDTLRVINWQDTMGGYVLSGRQQAVC